VQKPEINILNLQKNIRLGAKEIKNIKKIVLLALKSQSDALLRKINICLMDNQKIKKLNKKHLKADHPTDVLAFNIEETGEIAISAQQAKINAKAYKTEDLDELYLYVAHGCLHLLGYDDNTAMKRELMQNKASKILQNL
jgi:probable rRNA maturation factor